MKDTVAIVFNGGSYGTYLEWCLTTLCSDKEVQEPFTASGNSHQFKGNHLRNISGWQSYVASSNQFRFVRLHPKTKQTESLSVNLIEIAKDASHVIYVYPDHSRILLCVNNFFYKIWDNWLEQSFSGELDPNRIYANWPVDKNIPINQIPHWIKREFLSFYLMPAWFAQVEWNHIQHWQHPKSIVVTVSDLLFDFESTMLNIEKFCNLNYKQAISTLLPAHQKNLQLQKHIDHDAVCNQIINAVTNNIELNWDPLSLPSEAWIQWELRNQGFEIRCDGLDIFPTNSLHLKELLYPL